MIPTPAKQVSYRSEGINALAKAGQSMADGVGNFLESLAHEDEMKEIQQTGDLAALTKDVSTVVDEIREDLAESDVRNWNYNWDKAAQPRLKELVAKLPEQTRAIGDKMATAISQRASVENRRNTELSTIQQSQDKWNERLTQSEQEGDEDKCALWLNAGRGRFFAEDEYEQKQNESRGRCQLNRWQNRLDQEPLAALANLESEEPSDLPQTKEERKIFDTKRERVQFGVRSEMGNLFLQHIKEGIGMKEEQLALAKRANIISPQQYESAIQTPPKNSEPHELCRWTRHIDELDMNDEEKFTELKIGLGTATLASRDKQALLTRIDQLKSVGMSDRRNLSRQVWELYEQGYLGARQDTSSIKRLQALQTEGLEHIRTAGAEDTAQWLQSRKEKANSWICFSPKSTTKQTKA